VQDNRKTLVDMDVEEVKKVPSLTKKRELTWQYGPLLHTADLRPFLIIIYKTFHTSGAIIGF
jgi:hypothetical protein